VEIPVAGRERADLLAAADRAARRRTDRGVLVHHEVRSRPRERSPEAGIAAQQAGRLPEAAADYRDVLVHDPNNKYAYYDLGTIDKTNGALASAESNYRFALNS
jgi:tetratricopeptide (TPR) repeat protein